MKMTTTKANQEISRARNAGCNRPFNFICRSHPLRFELKMKNEQQIRKWEGGEREIRETANRLRPIHASLFASMYSDDLVNVV